MPYDESVVTRFWAKVRICEHGIDCDVCCWEWQAATIRGGYGRMYLTTTDGKKTYIPAHVMTWELHHQSFLSLDLWALHRCDNPRCCNYHHIFAGTHQDNMDDMCRKGRQVRGERHWARRYPERRPRGARHGRYTHPESIPRGEGHHATTLTAAQVVEMRTLASTEMYTCPALASRYGISPGSVWQIVVGLSWAHLPGALRPRWPKRRKLRQLCLF
jgi:hypothetical protein